MSNAVWGIYTKSDNARIAEFVSFIKDPEGFPNYKKLGFAWTE